MYIVFLYNEKDNSFGDVIERNLVIEEAKKLRDKLVTDGLPAHFELESVMGEKYKLKF